MGDMATLYLSVNGLPPSINSYFPSLPNGRRIVSKKGKAFKKLVKDHAFFKKVGPAKKETAYRLWITLSSPTWYCKNGNIKKEDLDNFLKCGIDSFCEALKMDDSQLFEIRASKIKDSATRTIYMLEEIE